MASGTLRTYCRTICGSVCFLIAQATDAQEVIPITITSEGHWLVKAEINSVEGNFILDTGGGLTLLTKNFASDVKGISKQDGGFTGYRATGERMDLDLFTVNEIKIGNYRRSTSTIAILDANLGGLDGLISLSDFRAQPFTIDYTNRTLTLETGESLAARKKQGTTIPIQIEGSREVSISVFSYFKVNDKLKLQVMLDSGAGNNVFKFNSKFMTMLGIDTADHGRVSRTFKRSEFNPALQTTIYKTRLERLASAVQPIIKDGLSVWFVDGLIYDGVISVNWLGNKVTFDLEKKEMIVD